MASGASRVQAAVIKSVQFEVFGKVQGVFFRKNTQLQAQQHGLVGWVRNTPQGTVRGIVQGEEDKLELMKHWLSAVGSKRARIERCLFKSEKTLARVEYTSFDIKK